MHSHSLLWIALVLIVIWVIAAFTKFVVGALLHLILVVAVICLLIWMARRIF